MDMGSDFDRLLFFEHARKAAEASYAKNPLDAENLTRWGGALIELSQFQSPGESKQMLSDAISKLEEALEINPKKHDAMWCLANAHTTHAFMMQDIEDAKPYFQKAAVYFQQAAEEDPTNDLYKKSLEVSAKAPELHAEIHKQQPYSGQGPAMGAGGPSNPKGPAMGAGGPSNPKTTTKKKKSSDFTYDVLGWVILAAGIVVWLGFAKNQAPPPPPRKKRAAPRLDLQNRLRELVIEVN